MLVLSADQAHAVILKAVATCTCNACCCARRCTPLCELYSVDMAFCGGEGLVTSKHTATFIMVCQKVDFPTYAWATNRIGYHQVHLSR